MTTNTPTPRVRITGGNAPVPDQLALYYEELEADVAAILEFARDQLPLTVESADDIKLVADFIKEKWRPIGERVSAAEELEKRPLMNATDSVRGFFRSKQERLDKAKKVLDARVKTYQDAEAAKARAKAAEEARIKREKEEAARREAEEARANADRVAAAAASEAAKRAGIEAQHLEQKADAKGAEHVRTTSASGATATMQTFWTFEIQDLQAVPPALLWAFVSDEAKRVAIGAFVKAGNRTLPGVRIYEDTRPTYR